MARTLLALLLVLTGCGNGAVLVVCVVEEHHLAWPAWEAARAEGRIPPGADLVHLDGHEDLGEPLLPQALPRDPLEARDLAARRLDVSEVVVPALLNGTVTTMIWVTPPWLAEAPRSRIRWVGSRGGERREIVLADEMDAVVFPDRRMWTFRVQPLADLEPPGDGYLLDVDLDAFACENPHADHLDREISREEYDRLLKAGEVEMSGEVTEGEQHVESVVLARPPGPWSWPVRLDRVHDLGSGEVRFVKGYICMGEYRDAFPVYRSSPEEVREMLRELKAALRRGGRPGFVTIARSATSGFVPADRVEAIERGVLEVIEEVFGAIEIRR